MTDTTTDTALPRLPFARRDVFDVPQTYRMLRAKQQISPVRTRAGDVAWLVSGYEDTRRLLNDDRLGRSHPHPERAARVSNSPLLGGPLGDYETEKVAHQSMRRLLSPAFSRRRMDALRQYVQSIVNELLDRLAERTPPADLHEELSFPLPALVICELLGVPYQDRDWFRVLTNELAGLADLEKANVAQKELNAYMRGLLAGKRAAPAEDVLSDLATVDDPGLDEKRRVELAAGLLFAGHETTVSLIDYGTVLLFTHPDQLDALRRDPGLAARAVEEMLRVAAPSDHGLVRYAHADIEVGEVTIKAGDAVVLATAAANRDETIFPDPDRFDISREPTDVHVGFGYGSHFCLGASLARVELQTVFGTLFQRFPTLQLAVPADQLRPPVDRLTGGFEELPVTWAD
jgi:cytochrome P450